MGVAQGSQQGLGYTYNAVNSKASQNIQALNQILSVHQKDFCKKYKDTYIQLLNTTDAVNMFKSLQLNVKDVPQIINMMTKGQAITTTKGTFSLPMLVGKLTSDPNMKKQYTDALVNFINVVLKNSVSKSGVIDGGMIRHEIIDVINSFCVTISHQPATSKSKSKFGKMGHTMMYSIIAAVVILLLVVGFIIYKKKKSGFGKRKFRR